MPVPQLVMECVVVRSDIYARVQSVVADHLLENAVAALVESGMREYDGHDPCWKVTRSIGKNAPPH